MVNRARGESELLVQGKSYRLLLTLGALAEIEDGLGLDTLSAIGPRLARTRAADIAIVAAALIRGGGGNISAAGVLQLPCPLSAVVAAMTEAFVRAGLSVSDAQARVSAEKDDAAGGEAAAARPFAGPASLPPGSGV